MIITAKLLESKKACSNQVAIFKQAFPNGTEVTKEACLKAYELKLDVIWAIDNLLDGKQKEAFKAIQQSAYKAYLAFQQPAWEAYLSIEQPAWKAYLAIEQPAWEAYDKERWLAFWKACNGI